MSQQPSPAPTPDDLTLDLTGRTALVTGGGVGIGRGIALALARAGADVALTYREHDGQAVADQIAQLGRTSAAYPLDATDSGQVDAVVADATERLGGRVDILVNNAGGLVARVPLSEMPDDHWRLLLDLNLSSAFYCTRAAVPRMPAGGRIVNISSLAADTGGGAGAGAYATAKAAMNGLTRALAKELGPRGITVNALAPGLILDTPYHERFTPEAAQREQIAAIPIGRPGYPADVAGAVLYLVSGLGSFCSGAVIDLNGGTHFS